MRLTRLVVTDDIGEWFVKEPVARWLHTYHEDQGDTGHWSRLADGLDCPFCVGFWIGTGVMASHSLAKLLGPKALGVWRFAAGALSLNEVAANLNVRVGDI